MTISLHGGWLELTPKTFAIDAVVDIQLGGHRHKLWRLVGQVLKRTERVVVMGECVEGMGGEVRWDLRRAVLCGWCGVCGH